MSRNESATTTPTAGGSKLCYIVKRPNFDGYGFNLHSEKIKPGQFIGKVDANSPASAAGLKEGDRIIEVNGVAIGSETHKQVVQRIKAIANEVRLLLLDTSTDGTQNKSSDAVDSSSNNNNNNGDEYHGCVQEMPGASANISTISMVSTKRMLNTNSNGIQTSTAPLPVPPPTVPDFTKNGSTLAVSAVVSNAGRQLPQESRSNTSQHNNNIATTLPSTTAAIASETQTVAAVSETESTPFNGNKSGSLQLPMTAAEMRAKLMSKKKYDPKNETVDLKKKFDIIQKL